MIDQIKGKIEKMKAMIFENSQYLATVENYQYLPLKEEDLLYFEETHKTKLPETFRWFLTQVGNGGLGPGYGILPLDLTRTHENLHLPWTDPEKYNDLFRYDSTKADEEAFDDRLDALLEDDDSPGSKLYDAKDHGVLPIADMGCGTVALLVINGKNKGQLWVDLTVNEDGLSFLAENFLVWYDTWLGQKIEKIQRKNLTLKNSRALYQKETPNFNEAKEFHAFMGQFLDVKDKKTVHKVLEQLVKSNNLKNEVMSAIIDYISEHQQFTNYPLALKFIDRAMDGLTESDASSRKSLLCQKGEALVHLKEYKKAKMCFDEALALDPKRSLDEEYIKLLAYAHLGLGNLEAAKSVITSSKPSTHFTDAVSLFFDIYENHHDFELTLLWGQQLLEWSIFRDAPHNKNYLPTVYLYLIYALIQLKDENQIETYLEKLPELVHDKNRVPYGEIALKFFEQKSFQKALLYLNKYESQPSAKNNYYWIHNLKGCCYSDMGDYEKGIAYFWKSFALHHWIVPYANLIRPYIHLGKFEEAERIFDEIVDFDPYYSWNYYQFSLFYLKTGEPQKAIHLLKKAIDLGFDKKTILEDVELKTVVNHL